VVFLARIRAKHKARQQALGELKARIARMSAQQKVHRWQRLQKANAIIKDSLHHTVEPDKKQKGKSIVIDAAERKKLLTLLSTVYGKKEALLESVPPYFAERYFSEPRAPPKERNGVSKRFLLQGEEARAEAKRNFFEKRMPPASPSANLAIGRAMKTLALLRQNFSPELFGVLKQQIARVKFHGEARVAKQLEQIAREIEKAEKKKRAKESKEARKQKPKKKK